MKFPYLLLPVTLAGLLLGACDPIQLDIILTSQVGDIPIPNQPDGGPRDAGPPPATPPDAGDCDNGWRSRELATNAMNLSFEFDSEGVGHYAVNQSENKIYVGSTRPGDSLAQAGELSGSVGGLAIDANGRRHLVYYGSSPGAYYAHERVGGGWQSTPLASNGYPTTLKLDTSGFAHVVLSLGMNGDRRLGYATNRSGQWEITDLGIKARNSRAELAVEPRGVAHLAWHDDSSSGGISYATNASGAWVIEQVSPFGGNEPVIELDPWGVPHLLYSEGGSYAQHAERRDGVWAIKGVGAANGIAIDLKVDAAGNLHALLDRAQNPKVVYARRSADGSNWSYTPSINLEGQGGVAHLWENVLGLDAAGKAHVGYWYIISSDTQPNPWNFLRYAEPCR
ncbi:MAG TPA: hypothetical protein VF794_40775 [Archangium sp.]|uniref:hypothetical protein n=1 Tax=Archangium sp. TaxID=1872627 RepID=UPI002EDA86E5